LTNLDLGLNQLSSFSVPADATNLIALSLFGNRLTNFSLPTDLKRLKTLGLSENQLSKIELPGGLTDLVFMNLHGNQLTNLSLPPDMQLLSGILLTGNPLATFVLSEPLAATNLAVTVATLQSQGVLVFTYPLESKLVSPRRTGAGAFAFTLTGPPGRYALLASTNLTAWSDLGTVTNSIGEAEFADAAAGLSPLKFYRARAQ
jgi:hypothetical protein